MIPQTPEFSRLPGPGLPVEAGKARLATQTVPYLSGGTQPPQRQVTNVLQALNDAGDFYIMARVLQYVGVTSLTPRTTWLMPNDQAFDSDDNFNTSANDDFFVSFLDYHVIQQLLPFTKLSTLKYGHRMPTFLRAQKCVVTDDRPDRFAINGAKVIAPDLFRDSSVAIHGIDAIMNGTIYDEPGWVESSASITSSSIGLFMTLAAASILLGRGLR